MLVIGDKRGDVVVEVAHGVCSLFGWWFTYGGWYLVGIFCCYLVRQCLGDGGEGGVDGVLLEGGGLLVEVHTDGVQGVNGGL